MLIRKHQGRGYEYTLFYEDRSTQQEGYLVFLLFFCFRQHYKLRQHRYNDLARTRILMFALVLHYLERKYS